MARSNSGTNKGGRPRKSDGPTMIKMATSDAPPLFIKACGLADVETTKRQLSKFNLGKGSANAFRNEAKAAMKTSNEVVN